MRKGFRVAAGIDNLFRTLSYNIKGDIPEIETDAVTQWDGSDADSVK